MKIMQMEPLCYVVSTTLHSELQLEFTRVVLESILFPFTDRENES